MSDAEPRQTRRWTRYVFLAVGVLLVGLLLWRFEPGEVVLALREARWLPLGGVVALTVAGFWIRAWKWRHALGPRRHAIGLFYIAKMAGHWSPGRIGEFSPLLLQKHRNLRVATWIVADRAMEVATTLVFGLLGMTALHLAPWWVCLLLWVGAAVGLAFVVLLLLVENPIVKPKARWGHRPWAARLLRLLDGLHKESRRVGRRGPTLAAATVIAKVTDLYGVVLLCQAFGYSVSLVLVCVARCAHAIVSGVPITPDATGIPFAAAGYFLNVHGGMPVETLVAAFGIEVVIINVVLYASFFVGMMDMRGQRQEKDQ